MEIHILFLEILSPLLYKNFYLIYLFHPKKVFSVLTLPPIPGGSGLQLWTHQKSLLTLSLSWINIFTLLLTCFCRAIKDLPWNGTISPSAWIKENCITKHSHSILLLPLDPAPVMQEWIHGSRTLSLFASGQKMDSLNISSTTPPFSVSFPVFFYASFFTVFLSIFSLKM